ncbi:MAG: YkgJ family cysteine cluster protein [Desulfomicrobium sp.]|jgi:Fe-S-cluster containining protein|nr:YkgJ family cysteine cluster protein [Desulfomicrobium sp.]NLV95925.1 YkgJ family cysteine cluster protein [Desulfovibrionales bacterium]
MKLDLSSYFSSYEALVAQIDGVFNKVANDFPTEVACRKGCSDCCHALFDISLVEALYLNSKFLELDEGTRHKILIDADKADRKVNVLKRKLSKAAAQEDTSKILAQVGKERIRCPLLDSDNQCKLYDFRPITCRLYGIPLEIDGKSHTCGLSAFTSGKPYPTVKVERIQDMLMEMSDQVLAHLGSTYVDFRYMLVPVSTALMTVYDESYFGVLSEKQSQQNSSGDA